jgi:hypothetical protein
MSGTALRWRQNYSKFNCCSKSVDLAGGRHLMKNNVRSGATLAVAAISIALAGVVTPAAATAGKVHCLGANSCKGKSDCNTPKNACKGMNACKGKGWVYMESEKACGDAGGKVLD